MYQYLDGISETKTCTAVAVLVEDYLKQWQQIEAVERYGGRQSFKMTLLTFVFFMVMEGDLYMTTRSKDSAPKQSREKVVVKGLQTRKKPSLVTIFG